MTVIVKIVKIGDRGSKAVALTVIVKIVKKGDRGDRVINSFFFIITSLLLFKSKYVYVELATLLEGAG